LEADIDRTYLSDIENGNKNLSVEVLEKISKGLGITLQEIFKRIEEL